MSSFKPPSFAGDRREVASERIQRPRAGITPTRVAIALRGQGSAWGLRGYAREKAAGAAHHLFRAMAHILPPGSEATRAVKMCKAWVKRATDATQ
eukprot:6922708-Prymnesium_polylepis.1